MLVVSKLDDVGTDTRRQGLRLLHHKALYGIQTLTMLLATYLLVAMVAHYEHIIKKNRIHKKTEHTIMPVRKS